MAHKSEDIKQIALANGWKAEAYPDLTEFDISGNPSDIVYKLYGIREDENIKVVWTGNLQTECVYTYGDYRLTPARLAGVLRLLKGRPDPNKAKKIADPKKIEEIANVPWEPDSPAFDIMLATVGKNITYVKKMTGEVCQLRVDVDLKEKGSARNFRVYETQSGRRILEWADTLGFHAIGLDQITRVD